MNRCAANHLKTIIFLGFIGVAFLQKQNEHKNEVDGMVLYKR
ncbi:hypothetical protein [Paenibacillus sp. RC62]